MLRVAKVSLLAEAEASHSPTRWCKSGRGGRDEQKIEARTAKTVPRQTNIASLNCVAKQFYSYLLETNGRQ